VRNRRVHRQLSNNEFNYLVKFLAALSIVCSACLSLATAFSFSEIMSTKTIVH